MSSKRNRTTRWPKPRSNAPDLQVAPVPVRPRADGWTPERQIGFLEALAVSGNVAAACRAVGMGTSSAYLLRTRPDADAFREGWRVALDMAVARAADAALERAIDGEVTPIFYKGEQVGERRRFDNRLATFILRVRDPARFGRWREERVPPGHPDATAHRFAAALVRVEEEALDQAAGVTSLPHDPLPEPRLLHPTEEKAMLMVRAQLAAAAEERQPHRPPDEDRAPEVDMEGRT